MVFLFLQSSLLMALLYELPLTSGEIHMSRNIAYVSQSAWVFSGTLKENVLFGQPYNREKYNKVIKACALDKACLFSVSFAWQISLTCFLQAFSYPLLSTDNFYSPGYQRSS
jgi:ABC-type uncharacterized transport system fused permease/ATPase subunit